MIEFYPRITDDGSVSLFNEDIDDIYHSSIGAYTESLMKFVYPSKILEEKSNVLSVLDICYGLGYNTKALLTEWFKNCNNKKLTIDAIEIDEWVVALSLMVKDDKTPYFIQKIIIDAFLRKSLVDKIDMFLRNKKFEGFLSSKNVIYIKSRQNRGIKYTRESIKGLSLHNIYYKYIPTRNIEELKGSKNVEFLKINLHIDDARTVIKQFCKKNTFYDYVFHDGFDPKKQSLLWTCEFFNNLNNIMNKNSNLTTYTSSAVVRGAINEAGFNLAVNRYNNKSVGTIAYKGLYKEYAQLNNFEAGLIATKAGIPYRDTKAMNLLNNDIINNRVDEINKSNRISSSQYIKEHKNARH